MATFTRRARKLAATAAGGCAALMGLAGPAMADTVYGLTATGTDLVTFASENPGGATAQSVTGLNAGDRLVGIDYRPATQQLYGVARQALTSNGQLYRIDPTSRVATPVGVPSVGIITGANQGFDFNPFPDRVRVVNDEPDDNLRLNPNAGGAPTVDTPLSYAAGDPNVLADPTVSAIAYTQSFGGATATRLFGIDTALDVLTRFGPGNADPNNGQMTTVGPLGVAVDTLSGFDISPTGLALAALTVTGETRPRLYHIDVSGPTAGAARQVGRIGNATSGPVVTDIAIAPKVRRFVALTDGTPQKLVTFAANRPGTALATVSVTGLPAGVRLVGVDTRTATGKLYGAGSDSRLYLVDLNGTATVVGTGFTALVGTRFGFDFNPQADRIRIVSDAEQNQRLVPDTGASAITASPFTDTNLSPAGNVVGAAYTNPAASPANTTLFVIDSTSNQILRQGSVDGAPSSPNAGVLEAGAAIATPAGVLTVFDPTDKLGYEIVPEFDQGFLATDDAGTPASEPILYSLNPAGGAANQAIQVGRIATPGTELVDGLAFLDDANVPTPPPVTPPPPVVVNVPFPVPFPVPGQPLLPRLVASVGTGEEITRGTLSRKGLRVVVTCSTRCSYAGTLTLDARTARRLGVGTRLATRSGSFGTAGGSRASAFKPSARARRALRRVKGGTLTVRFVVRDASSRRRTVSAKVRIRP